jgi:hypothetical protein
MVSRPLLPAGILARFGRFFPRKLASAALDCGPPRKPELIWAGNSSERDDHGMAVRFRHGGTAGPQRVHLCNRPTSTHAARMVTRAMDR